MQVTIIVRILHHIVKPTSMKTFFSSKKQQIVTIYTNIEEALKHERPTDKVVKIINNKFAIVKPMYTDGSFSDENYCALGTDGKTIYFYCSVKGLKRYYESFVKDLPNVKPSAWCDKNGKWKVKKSDNRKYKHTYRRLMKLIQK